MEAYWHGLFLFAFFVAGFSIIRLKREVRKIKGELAKLQDKKSDTFGVV